MNKQAICAERVRHVPKQFSWVDQRLVRYGYTQRVSPSALALYLFLVVVGDGEGLSFYSDRAIVERLAFSQEAIVTARRELVAAGLIAYRQPLYQVLSLEDFPQRQESRRRAPQSTSSTATPSTSRLHSIAEVFAILGQERK